MSIDLWTTRQRWLYAIKPGSWPKLLVPFVLGQALGVFVAGRVDLNAVLFGLVFTILDGLYIVLMNDWGDQKVDRIKREMFPDGCSPKTIPDGVLPASSLLRVGLFAGAAAVAVAFAAQEVLQRPELGGLGLLAVGLFAAYTLPPLKLNYRGGGELLEAIGVGAVLPLFNAYLQSGTLWHISYELLAGSTFLALASAIASGLSDEESDRAGGKRTFTTMFGNAWSRGAVLACVRVGMVAWIVGSFRADLAIFAPLATIAVCSYHTGRMRARAETAVTNAFAELKRYKLHLHNAIWYGTLTLSAALLVHYLYDLAFP